MTDHPDLPSRDDQPPPCGSERERELMRRMCIRARVPFTEWDCARLLTEFKRNLTQRQWAWMRSNPSIRDPEDALRSLIMIGFENRRFKRMRLRGRGRDRIWAEPRQQARLSTLLETDPDAQGRGKAVMKPPEPDARARNEARKQARGPQPEPGPSGQGPRRLKRR